MGVLDPTRQASFQALLSSNTLQAYLQLGQEKMDALAPNCEHALVLEPSHPRFSTLCCPVSDPCWAINAEEAHDKR